MRRSIPAVLMILAAASFVGCGGSASPMRFYSLSLPAVPKASGNPYPVTLLVGHIQAPPILRDDRILYRTGTYEMGTYQYLRWAAPPAEMVGVRLLRVLRGSGRYESVTDLGSSARGDYVVRGRLGAFDEVDGPPVNGRVVLEVELYNQATGQTVWSQFYSHDEPASGNDITDVVAALDRNLQQGLEAITAGLDQYFAKNQQSKSEIRN
jgi:ABC-type uncharacterized transport system auxiliary subunit